VQVVFDKGVFTFMSPSILEISKITEYAKSIGYHTFTCGKNYYFGDTQVTAYLCYVSEIKALIYPELALWRQK